MFWAKDKCFVESIDEESSDSDDDSSSEQSSKTNKLPNIDHQGLKRKIYPNGDVIFKLYNHYGDFLKKQTYTLE